MRLDTRDPSSHGQSLAGVGVAGTASAVVEGPAGSIRPAEEEVHHSPAGSLPAGGIRHRNYNKKNVSMLLMPWYAFDIQVVQSVSRTLEAGHSRCM